VIVAVDANAARLAYNYAQRVEGGAKRRVHVITGRLKASIQRIRMARGHHRVVVGAYYGIYEEFGTRYRPPHPFFRPAVAAAKAQYDREKIRVFNR
jgi:HK97 gp10 family phage protein